MTTCDCNSAVCVLGYVPQESDDNSASLTLTYAYDDFVLAELCDYVGDVDNAQVLRYLLCLCVFLP